MLGVPLPLAVFEGVSGPPGDTHVARSQEAPLADRDPRSYNCKNHVSSEVDLSPDCTGSTYAAATLLPPRHQETSVWLYLAQLMVTCLQGNKPGEKAQAPGSSRRASTAHSLSTCEQLCPRGLWLLTTLCARQLCLRDAWVPADLCGLGIGGCQSAHRSNGREQSVVAGAPRLSPSSWATSPSSGKCRAWDPLTKGQS